MDDVRVYVGNLPFKTTDAELEELFNQYGEVKTANVIRYKRSGRSKGYAFVIMSEEGSEEAVESLNDKEYESRMLKVRLAKPRENYPRRNASPSKPDSYRSDRSEPETTDFKSFRIGID